MRTEWRPGTGPGESLAPADADLVEELRKRLSTHLPSAYDTDFCLYRWLAFAARLGAKCSASALAMAERNLRHHLKYRKAMRLDTEPIPSFEDNPLHQSRILPTGHLDGVDKQNRVLWTTEFGSLVMDGMFMMMRSSEMLLYHFWLYEILLARVKEQEALTGRLSGLRVLMDLADYPMNPLGMAFASGGGLGYVTQLFHMQHYPLVCHTVDILNGPRWIAVPYKLIKDQLVAQRLSLLATLKSDVLKAVMPASFSEQFRVHDTGFQESLLAQIEPDQLADFLGGSRPNLRSLPARTVQKAEYYQPSPLDPDPNAFLHFHVRPRRQKLLPIDVRLPNTYLSWFFHTDADLLFGVFRDVQTGSSRSAEVEEMEMVWPLLRLAGRFVPEEGSVLCERPGRYFLVFCNKSSWLSRKSIRVHYDLGPFHSPLKPSLDRALSC